MWLTIYWFRLCRIIATGFLFILVQVFRFRDEFLEFVEDFTADRDIDCRLVFIVVGKQIRISSKQKLQAEPVTVLWAKMARSIAVDIFGVDVCTVLNQSLYHTQITSETGDVQRCTEIVRSSINLRPEFNKDLD